MPPQQLSPQPHTHPPVLPASPQPTPFLGTRNAASPLSQRYGILLAEVAARIEPLADILIRHGISRTEWHRLRRHPGFETALKEHHAVFNSPANIATRIKVKAQILTEYLLDHMGDIASHIANPASARVSAFQAVKSLTGLERPEDAAPMRQFNLRINLGNGITKTAEAITLEAVNVRDATEHDHTLTFTEDNTPLPEDEEVSNLDEEVLPASPAPVRTWASFSNIQSQQLTPSNTHDAATPLRGSGEPRVLSITRRLAAIKQL